jgi:hypothetical protein
MDRGGSDNAGGADEEYRVNWCHEAYVSMGQTTTTTKQ